MAIKKVFVTSKGCYATDKDGKTIELPIDSESLVEDAQAAIFVKSGKAKLIANAPKKAKSSK